MAVCILQMRLLTDMFNWEAGGEYQSLFLVWVVYETRFESDTSQKLRNYCIINYVLDWTLH